MCTHYVDKTPWTDSHTSGPEKQKYKYDILGHFYLSHRNETHIILILRTWGIILAYFQVPLEVIYMKKWQKTYTFLGEDKKIYNIFKGTNLIFMSTR